MPSFLQDLSIVFVETTLSFACAIALTLDLICYYGWLPPKQIMYFSLYLSICTHVWTLNKESVTAQRITAFIMQTCLTMGFSVFDMIQPCPMPSP